VAPQARSVVMGGADLHRFAGRLFPLCRSLTGRGVRDTFAILCERIPLQVREIPSGSQVFDWEVPLEWNVESAWLRDPGGEVVADLAKHNLHLVGYSAPVNETLALEDLQAHLYSDPMHSGWIPYRTCYYRRHWGFCLPHDVRVALQEGTYHAEIVGSLAPGSLTYGEWLIPGASRDEVLFFTHTCHPSLANDNASGMAVTTALAEWIASSSRRLSYRLIFAPGTIGSLCWLQDHEDGLRYVRGGLTLGLLGDASSLTYKRSRREDTFTDAVGEYVVSQFQPSGRVLPFSPYGYDERQFCSPGFDLPIGRLSRAINGGFAEYHSSADDMAFIRPEQLEQSLDACKLFVEIFEADARYVNLAPKGEPQLGKRGLYGAVGGQAPADREHAMLWLLNQSDGSRSLLDVARRSGLGFGIISEAAAALERAGLLQKNKDRP
jgi:aminopeptidase-like protein